MKKKQYWTSRMVNSNVKISWKVCCSPPRNQTDIMLYICGLFSSLLKKNQMKEAQFDLKSSTFLLHPAELWQFTQLQHRWSCPGYMPCYGKWAELWLHPLCNSHADVAGFGEMTWIPKKLLHWGAPFPEHFPAISLQQHHGLSSLNDIFAIVLPWK